MYSRYLWVPFFKQQIIFVSWLALWLVKLNKPSGIAPHLTPSPVHNSPAPEEAAPYSAGCQESMQARHFIPTRLIWPHSVLLFIPRSCLKCILFSGEMFRFWVRGGGVCAEAVWDRTLIRLSCTFSLISIIRAEMGYVLFWKSPPALSFFLSLILEEGWVCSIRSHDPERIEQTWAQPASPVLAVVQHMPSYASFYTNLFYYALLRFFYVFMWNLSHLFSVFLWTFWHLDAKRVHVFTHSGSHSGWVFLTVPRGLLLLGGEVFCCSTASDHRGADWSESLAPSRLSF